ncbi:MAG TPA: TIR domain-containing protein [Kofleriaceae bacterium]
MTERETQQAGRFDAFISYSRRDIAFARKLQSVLESYVPPIGLGLEPRSLRVFRDESDIQGSRYYNSIDDHLRQSRRLVLICSPSARQSRFVDDELTRFLTYRRPDDIIPVLLSGKPNGETKVSEHWAFPDVLMDHLGEPRALEMREFDPRIDEFDGQRWVSSWYSLLADLFGLERRVIEERDSRRRFIEGSVRAKDLWYRSYDARIAGYWLESLHRLADAHEQAPPGAVKRNLRAALFHALPEVEASNIWQGDGLLIGGTLSPGGTHLVVWSDRCRALGFDMATGACLRSDVTHERAIQTGRFLTESCAATTDLAGRVNIFDLRTNDAPVSLERPSPVLWLMSSDTEPLVATLNRSGPAISRALDPSEELVTLWDWRRAALLVECVVAGWPRCFFCNRGQQLAIVVNGRLLLARADGKVLELKLPEDASVMSFGPEAVLIRQPSRLHVMRFDASGQPAIAAPLVLDDADAVKQCVADQQGRFVIGLTVDERIIVIDTLKQSVRVIAQVHGLGATELVYEGCGVITVHGIAGKAAYTLGGALLWKQDARATSDPLLAAWLQEPSRAPHGNATPFLPYPAASLFELGWQYSVMNGKSLSRSIGGIALGDIRVEGIGGSSGEQTARQRAASFSSDQRIRFWKLRTARPSVPRTTYGQVAFSSFAFGKIRLGFASEDGLVHLLDPFLGALVHSVAQTTPALWGVLLDANDTTVFGRAGDTDVVRWPSNDGRPEPQRIGFPIPITQLSTAEPFDRAGALLADGSLHIVRLSEDLVVEGILRHQGNPLGNVQFQFSADGCRLVTWAQAGPIRMWDVSSRQELCSPIAGTGSNWGAWFNSSGSRVLTWNAENECIVKDIASGRELTIRHFGNDGTFLPFWQAGIAAARFSVNGDLVFTASSDRTVGVWDAETGERILPLLEHRSGIDALLPSYDDRSLLVSAGDRVSLWDLRTGKRAFKDVIFQGGTPAICWGGHEERWVGFTPDGTIRVLDRDTGLPLAEFAHPGGQVSRVTLNADDTEIVSCSKDGIARVWKIDPDVEPTRWKDAVELTTASRYDKDSFEIVALDDGEFRERSGRLAGFADAPDVRSRPVSCACTRDALQRLRIRPTGLLGEKALRELLRDQRLFDGDLNPAPGIAPAVEDRGNDIVAQPDRDLLWQRTGSPAAVLFTEALKFVSDLNAARFGGFADWRLPSLLEAMSLMTSEGLGENLHIPDVFDRKQTWIWTSSMGDAGAVWTASYGWARCRSCDPTLPAFVRAVRWAN